MANVKPRVLLLDSATDAISPGPAVPDAHARTWPVIDAFLAEG